jgi:hypothetical protein
VNGMTAPGYFMFLIYTVFTILTLVKFKEPAHRYKPSNARYVLVLSQYCTFLLVFVSVAQ